MSSRSFGRVLMSAVALSVLTSALPVHAQPAFVDPPMVPGASQDGPSTSTAPLSVFGFLVVTAHAAGAEQVCEPPMATDLRLCAQTIVDNWRALTGQQEPGAFVLGAVPVIWKHAFMTAYTLQSQPMPPVSCDVVRSEVRNFAFWTACGMRSPASQ